MTLFILFLILGFSTLILATYTDLRSREVPDSLSYGLIFSGLLLRSIESIITLDYSYIILGIIGFAGGFGIGYLMFIFGQWGGGDVKLLAGLGCLYAGPFSLLSSLPWYGALGVYLVFISLAGAAYTLSTMVALSVMQQKAIRKQAKIYASQYKKKLIISTASGASLILVSFFFTTPTSWFMLLVASCILILPFLFIYSKAVETACFVKKYPAEKLTEGDWVLDTIKIKGKTIYSPKENGISKEQIELCKQEGLNHIKVKEGIPFVPAFLLAFLILIWKGDYFLLLFISFIS